MSISSYVRPYVMNPRFQADEVEPIMGAFEFENTDAVLCDPDDEFDNFTIDLSKLPEGTKYIKFTRG